jgi:hypothetical protein
MPPPQASGLAPQPGPGGYVPSSAQQKTIVAGMAPPIAGMGMAMPPPGMQQQQPPGMGMPPPGMQPPPGMPPGPGANKTIALQSTEGIVSIARTGGPVQPAGTGMIQQGASTAFWIVSLLIGIAVGALAYVVALQL